MKTTISLMATVAIAGFALIGCSPATTEEDSSASSSTESAAPDQAQVVSLQVSGMK